MKIIIIGNGKVGYSLAENLSAEDNDITVIDNDAEALRRAAEDLDVMCIKGNGVSTSVLMLAGVKNADVVIATTNSDELNMVCCMTAKKLGATHTIARIRDPEYASELSQLMADLALDLVINPEQAVASEIVRLLEFPPAIDIEIFANGRVIMVEMKVTENLSIAGKALKDIAQAGSSSVLIGAVVRGEEVVIPRGNFVIEEGDIVYVVGRPSRVYDFSRKIGVHVQKIKNVMILGGGRVGYYLAKTLSEMDIKVKIIEQNRARCEHLTELLPRALIIHGDGTDEKLLLSENIEDMASFISVTGHDEDNVISALLAKQYGVSKAIAKINRGAYFSVIKNMAIDNVVSPKLITSNHILRYIRGLKNAEGNPVKTLYRLVGGRVEAVEFDADRTFRLLDRPLKDLPIAGGILIAAIVRNNKIIIPRGNDVIRQGDSVILITKDRPLTDLNDILLAKSGLE
jgi:trk system potassium uptake protein TrkA